MGSCENNYSRIAWDIKAARTIPPREWTGKEDLYDTENSAAEDEARMISENEGLVDSFDVPYAIKKYHTGHGICYNEEDFVEYLNRDIFPDRPSQYVETRS